METKLNLSYEGADEIQSLLSDAGASEGKRLKIVLEATVSEMAEDGAALIPDSIITVESIESEEDEMEEDAGDDETTETVPGMVEVMEGREDKS
jgi:hypothetical protein